MRQEIEVNAAGRVLCQQTHGGSHCSYERARKDSEWAQQKQTVCERAYFG